MPPGALEAGIVAAAWALALYLPSSRNRRFLAFLAAWSALWLATWLLDPGGAKMARTALVGLIALALAAPEYLSIGSVTLAEKRLDARITEHWKLARGTERSDHDSIVDAVRAATAAGDMRRLAVRLRAWADVRREGRALVASATPASYFERAAADFLHDARWRRVIGSRARVTAWDEEVALRCYFEATDALIPPEALVARPVVALGDWDGRVERLLSELRDARVRDPIVAELRDTLAEAIESTLQLATGERSIEALDRQRAAARAAQRAWEAARVRIEALGDGRPAR